MRVEINNLGIVEKADISLNGITVLVGPNNTGKTTVGEAITKVLDFSINKEYYINEQLLEELNGLILHLLESWLRNKNDFNKQGIKTIELLLGSPSISTLKINNILIPNLFENKDLFKEYFHSTHKRYSMLNKELSFDNNINDSEIEDYFESNIRTFYKSINRNEISSYIFKRNKDGKSMYKLLRENSEICLYNQNNSELFNYPNHLYKGNEFNPIIYSVLEVNKTSINRITDLPNVNQLKVLTNNKDNILEIISGNLKDDKFYGYNYIDQNGIELPLNEAASGIQELAKWFVLIDKEKIGPGQLIFVDEPETSLHPAWQIFLAELMVQLMQEGVYFVIATHSPIFLTALDNAVSEKGLDENMNIYLAKKSKETGMAVFEDVSDDLDAALNSLFGPYYKMVWG